MVPRSTNPVKLHPMSLRHSCHHFASTVRHVLPHSCHTSILLFIREKSIQSVNGQAILLWTHPLRMPAMLGIDRLISKIFVRCSDEIFVIHLLGHLGLCISWTITVYVCLFWILWSNSLCSSVTAYIVSSEMVTRLGSPDTSKQMSRGIHETACSINDCPVKSAMMSIKAI